MTCLRGQMPPPMSLAAVVCKRDTLGPASLHRSWGSSRSVLLTAGDAALNGAWRDEPRCRLWEPGRGHCQDCRRLGSKQPRNFNSGGWPQVCISLPQRCCVRNGMVKHRERGDAIEIGMAREPTTTGALRMTGSGLVPLSSRIMRRRFRR